VVEYKLPGSRTSLEHSDGNNGVPACGIDAHNDCAVDNSNVISSAQKDGRRRCVLPLLLQYRKIM
jgi:hypothetical protein